MPFALYVLALAVFAQGTSEFMLSGLLPDLARDTGVPIGTAGTLTSAFAAGMVVGAPLMAVLARRWPRRRALLLFLGAFLAVHVAGALTSDFAVLLGTRVVAALANAGFLAVAVAAAVAMVRPDAKGRATATLLGGVTLACVAGVPAGALLGRLWGWRAAFWAVALLSAPALAAILTSVPDEPSAGTSVRPELRVLRRPDVLLVLAVGALVNGATFCAFTYLAPLVTEVAGFGDGWVPVLLAVFGLGSFAGVTASGRLADTRPRTVLAGGGLALVAGWAALAAFADVPALVVPLVFAQGALGFGVGSTLIARALYAASDAPTLAGAFATAALNVGAVVGPVLGGLAMDGDLGYRAPVWVSTALAASAVVLGVRLVTVRGGRADTSLLGRLTSGRGARAVSAARRGADPCSPCSASGSDACECASTCPD
ncbi:DHA1 family chloramphenicol resistance protein-like MFS transporter [Actinomadura rupiterrae]|nr:Cmx/CmrA family chloramphenicol efflux MFS transporter [Actinomadura rupiterrae]MCP2335840.1 DHA1 family chloramphenicol resistance protein-like MFS transporter [Actinomadura rupiterrae]